MFKIKVYNRQLVEATDMQALSNATLENIKEAMKPLIKSVHGSENVRSEGLNATANGAYVDIAPGKILVDGLALILTSTEAVNVFETPANATNPKIVSICIAPLEQDVLPESRWFLDDQQEPPVEYQQTVDTQIKVTYQFQAVHGTPAASPTPPTIPEGFVELVRVTVPAGSTTVSQGNIVEQFSISSGVEGKLEANLVGTANGVASLDSGGKVPSNQLRHTPKVVSSLPGTTEALAIFFREV